MASWVKLSVRLPARVHERLASRARREGRSLNSAIVAALSRDLEDPDQGSTERQRIARRLSEMGMWRASPRRTVDESEESHAELRAMLRGCPGLSDIVIEDRGPR